MMTEIETLQDGYDKAEMHKSGHNHSEIDEASLRGSLASSVYHDLRHPLTAILAYSELLAENDLDAAQREDFHNEIRRAVDRMNDLISLLLEFSKGATTLGPEVVDIPETVRHAIQVVAVRPEFRGIVIRYDHQAQVRGYLDPKRLQQVIINVVLNACEAVSPRTGRIQVTSVGREEAVEIAILDNGPGIPQAVRHAIFQPFVSFGKRGGTGLGLAIVQKILHDQGGEIYLEPAHEKGTLFRLAVPFSLQNPPRGPDCPWVGRSLRKQGHAADSAYSWRIGVRWRR